MAPRNEFRKFYPVWHGGSVRRKIICVNSRTRFSLRFDYQLPEIRRIRSQPPASLSGFIASDCRCHSPQCHAPLQTASFDRPLTLSMRKTKGIVGPAERRWTPSEMAGKPTADQKVPGLIHGRAQQSEPGRHNFLASNHAQE